MVCTSGQFVPTIGAFVPLERHLASSRHWYFLSSLLGVRLAPFVGFQIIPLGQFPPIGGVKCLVSLTPALDFLGEVMTTEDHIATPTSWEQFDFTGSLMVVIASIHNFDPFEDSLLAGKSILFSCPLGLTSTGLLGVR